MKKRIFLAISLVTVICMIFAGGIFAHAETEGIYIFTVSSGYATITGVDASASGIVNVPSSLGGYPVKRIAENAFKGRSNITSLTIPDSVEKIGCGAFKDCTGLTEITIPFVGSDAGCTTNPTLGYVFDTSNSYLPSTLKKVTVTGGYRIGERAFDSADCISTVILPETITAIDPYAFSNCTSLKTITIPSSVLQIDEYAFYASGLTSVSLNDGLLSVGNYAFASTSLTGVTIPDSVTSVGEYAFAWCKSLLSVNLSGSMAKVQEGMFEECTSLQSVSLPVSINSIDASSFKECSALAQVTMPAVSYIGESAFENCEALQSVVLPEGLLTLEQRAFYGDIILNSVSLPSTLSSISSEVFYGCELSSLTIPEGISSVGSMAFANNNNLKTISIPASLESIGTGAFSYCPLLESVTVASGNPVYSINSNCLVDNDTGAVILGYSRSTIPATGSITEIAKYAFAGQTTLTSLTIPSNIELINDYALDGCSGLVKLTVPDSVETIGLGAFHACVGLTEITIPFVGANAGSTTNPTIGYMFGCSNSWLPTTLKKVTVTGGYRIGESAFNSADYISTVILPEIITAIDSYAFNWCTSLKTITIPSSVLQIDEYAFYSSGLASVSLNDGLLSIGNYAFASTPLAGVTIPDTVTSVGEYAFASCESLLRANLSGSMAKVQEGMFAGCTSLQTVSWPASIKAIDKNAYYGCTSLTKITVPGTVAIIGESAFSNCTSITNAVIEDGVTSIGDNAFDGCTSMLKVTVPRSVTSIGTDAFANRNENLKMYGYKDSYAETYASENNIKFVYLEEPDDPVPGTYTAKFTADGKTVSEESYAAGAAIVVPDAPAKTGYKFVRWNPAVPSVMPENNLVFTAVYEANKYNVTYDFTGGSVDGNTSYVFKDVAYGSEIPVYDKTPVKEGFTFSSWKSDYTGTTMPDYTVVYLAQWKSSDPSHTHTPYTVRIEPTCTEEGTEYTVCSECGEPLSSATPIPATGHTVETVKVEATCTTEGSSYEKCSVCGEILSETTIIPKTDHTPETVTVEATCAKEGSTYQKCSVCGAILSEKTVIPKKDHTPETITEEATCTKEGSSYEKCSVCGAILSEKTVILKKAHTPGEWKTIKKPTETETGKKELRCTVCNTVIDEQIIPKLTVLKDDGTKITVTIDSEDYEDDVSLVVKQSPDKTAFNLVNTKTGAGKALVYDVKLIIDGKEVQPNGTVIVRIPIPEGYDRDHSFVYHVNTETGTVEKMNSHVEGNFLVFETNHFSYYAVVDESVNTSKTVLTSYKGEKDVDYKVKVKIIASATNLPAGYKIAIFDGTKKVAETTAGADKKASVEYTSDKLTGDKTYYVQILDATGAVQKDASGNDLNNEIKVNVNDGFFAKIIAFFKDLFGMLKNPVEIE